MDVMKLFTLPILLILSGDVELNPGPRPKLPGTVASVRVSRAPKSDGSRDTELLTDQMTDIDLRIKSRQYTEADWPCIGDDLGYNSQELANYRKKYPRLQDAFFQMIKAWRDNGGVRRGGGSIYVKKLTMTFNRPGRPPMKEDQERKEREKEQERERERKKKEKELAIFSHPDIKPRLSPCKCGRFHAKCETKDVVEIWNKHLREARKVHETNMRIVLFAPLLYNRSTLAPKWQQWMRKQDLIIDDMAPLERKKEVFYRLDELDKVLEYIHTKLSTMKSEDYNSMTWLLEDVERVEEFHVALEIARNNSYFTSFYENLKTRKKMKDSSIGRLMALVTIKQYWQYVHHTVIHKKDILASLMKLGEKDEKEMNTLKDKGNNLFKNSKYRSAHEMYTKALAIGVFNHILYSNRCQTSLHMEDFWDALWDARRAVTIKPDWQKGHYRYAQAFYELKDIDRAMRENKRGQKLCDDSGSQTGDLQKQATMFNDEKRKQVSLNSKKNEVPDLVSNSESDSDSDSDNRGKSKKQGKLPDIQRDLQKSKQNWEKKKKEDVRKKEEEAKRKKEEEERKAREAVERRKREQEERDRKRVEEMFRKTAETERRREEERFKREQERIRKEEEKHRKKVEKAERKRREANKQAEDRLKREEKERHTKEKEKQAQREAEIATQQKEQMRKENERFFKERNAIEKCLADGSLALVSGQCRQAITQYEKAAELLKATNKKNGGMHEADYIVFLYAQATAYLKSGIPSEINEALSRFESITKDFPSMRNGLPFYGLATSLFKLNRFNEALDPIEKSLFITTHFEQTIHTWPGTSTSIAETEKGKLEAALKDLQRWCKNPPSPDATCRYGDCTIKREMYLSDLDFKGYIRVQCSERCYIDYHIQCWKAIKSEKNILGEKEALKTECSTPDCAGTLSNIKVIGANGLLKTEAKVEKPPKPPKDDTKKKNVPKQPKDQQKKGKKFRKPHHGESSKTEKGQGDAEDQAGHGHTAEGAHAAKEDASHKPAAGATKARSGSDAGIAAATESTSNDASGSHQVEGAEAEVEEIKPEATYVLKRDEFEDADKKKASKVKPKKSRKPVVLDEEATNIVHFDFGPNHRQLYGADDAEELQERMNRGWHSTLTVSEDRPFAVPPHLQDAAREIEASFLKEASIILPETDEEKSQRMVLYLHFNDIFINNGPLHLQDPIVTGSMEQLTFEHQELIVKRGGLERFLRESEDMIVIGDYASLKSDEHKCRELAILNGYQERKTVTDVAGYALNPNCAPFIPRVDFSMAPSVFHGGQAGDNNLNSTLLSGLDQFTGSKRGPVSGLDSFEADDGSAEEEEDEDEEDESKTGESEATKNESDDEDSSLSSSDDDDGDDEEDSDDELDADDSFHDASSEMQESKFDGIESELYQSTTEGNVTSLADSKVDGIDDEDYHWEDHYSSKELTVEELEDVLHEEKEMNNEHLSLGQGERGTGENRGNNEPIDHSNDNKPSNEPKEGLGGQEDGINLAQAGPSVLELDNSDGISVCIDAVQQPANIEENSESVGAVGADATHSGLPTGQSSTELSEETSEMSIGAVNQAVKLDEANSDEGTPVDRALNPQPHDEVPNDEVPNASDIPEVVQPIPIPVTTPTSNSTNVVDSELIKSEGQGEERRTDAQDLPRTPLSESDYEKMFEKRFKQWKEQHPASPVEKRSFGTNTDGYLEDQEQLNQKIKSLHMALEEAERRRKLSNDNMIRYREAVDKTSDAKLNTLKQKHQEEIDSCKRMGMEERKVMEEFYQGRERHFHSQLDKFQELEEIHKSCESTKKNYEQLEERYGQLVAASAEETASLKSEISILKNSVKDKEKVNKMLEKQSKKLMVDRQELQDRMDKLHDEMSALNEERLTAEARRTQMKMAMEESQKVPKELEEANHALEMRLKGKEEEATKLLNRACKAECQFLHLFMAKELKPLEEACKEAEYHIKTIANIIQNNPMMEEHVRAIRSMWQDCLATNQRAVSKAQNEFEAQIQAIQGGANLDSLKPVEVAAPYKPEGLNKSAFGHGSSPTPQASLTPPASMAQAGGVAAPGSWLLSNPRQGGAPARMSTLTLQGGTGAQEVMMERAPHNGRAVEDQLSSQPLTVTEPENKAAAMALAEAMAAQAHAQAQAQAQQLQQAQAQAMSRAQTPPVVSQEATVQQAAMSGNGFNHHQPSNGQPGPENGQQRRAFTVPPNMQHAQQMHMSHQQGAAARFPQQLTLQQQQQQQQMLARQQYMQQQVARPKNSFERIMLRLNGLFPNYNKVQLTGFLKEVRSSNNGSLSGLSVDEIMRRVSDLVRQRHRETAGNASQRMQNKGFINQQGMPGGRPAAPLATFNSQPQRSATYQPAPTPTQPAWTTVGSAQKGFNWHKELVDGEEEEEDPCVICHDEMSGDNILEIECGHIFHSHCIQEWLKQQNTCPTCRNYTILKDDYPSLHK